MLGSVPCEVLAKPLLDTLACSNFGMVLEFGRLGAIPDLPERLPRIALPLAFGALTVTESARAHKYYPSKQAQRTC